jgi:5-methylcytosine-specific restriction endonuclease McrA
VPGISNSAREEARHLNLQGLKRCPRCGVVKAHPQFDKNTGRWDGLYSWCRPCNRGWAAAAHTRNRVKWASGVSPYANPAKKRCADCRLDRPREDFSTSPSAADGLRGYCRSCWSAREAARKAKKRSQFVEHVDRDVAWRMANGICYLCNLPCDPARWDLDHVNPIDNGGEHSYFNTAPTHPECNRSKGAKTWPKLHVWDHTTSDWVLSA